MVVINEAVMKVCDVCFAFHNKYAKNLPFSFAKKEAVGICCCCGGSMCEHCVQSSYIQTAGTVLATYGFELCADCCSTIWTQTPLRLLLEREVKASVLEVKGKIKKAIYSVTQKQTW